MSYRTRVAPFLQRPYAWFWLGTMVLRLPWWVITNLTPAQRPRKSWTLKKAVFLQFIRAWLVGLERSSMKLISAPTSDQNFDGSEAANGVYVNGAPHLVTGKIKEWAETAGVGAERITGYWMHKKDANIVVEQKPDKDEKIVYFLHGGGYTMASAHPDHPCSNICHAFLDSCPSVKRTFNLEYRLTSIPPEPTRGQFPSALIDAISGYNYLINKLGFSSNQIIVAGNSAGANLALALTRYLLEYKRTTNLPDVPSALVLLSPWADMSGSHWYEGSSFYTNAKHDTITLFRTPHAVDAPPGFIEPFGPDIASQNPYISPASLYLENVRFEGFPRTFINAGDVEVLLDQCRELYRRMKISMGEDKVIYYEGKDAWHDCVAVFSDEAERSETVDVIKCFVEHGDLPHIVSCEDFLESFRASRSQSRRFKGILCTLRTLTDSLEEATEHTEKSIETIAMHLGLARLPDELLSRILWHAALTLSEAVQLCEVCTRFRSVLLSSPEIWAKFPLTVNTTPRQITTIVERSGVMPLKARIEPITYFAPNVNGVLDYSARLQELTVSPVNDPILHPQFDTIHLPILSSLGMTWSKYIRNERTAQNGFGQRNVHIYETWTMPHLRFLEANFVPHPLPGTGIVQCELNFDEDSIRVDDLLSFLGSLPRLKKAKISFAQTSAWQGNKPDPAINLPNLRSLSISIAGKISTSLLNRILSNLSCEGVSEVSFDLKASSWMDEMHHHAFDMDYETASSVEDVDFRGWSKVAIQFMQRQRHLRSLNVAVDVTQGRGDYKSMPPIVAEAIRDILSNIPSSLETFVLSKCITVCWKSERDSCRQIDYIRVTDANPYTIALLQIIKAVIVQHNFGPGRIIIDRCIPLDNDFGALLACSDVS
ncbi:alpha/beta-hydrolase [Sanghuangporus baumii]|uniref:Alpha/beta-hydrolase n=1 Tax=Sanghuangporus baumii TaxID=108892 RepID=A0A9Q5I3V7_SANBA|nr:alpha/beta-hydrolase [Sanghuangporus baumii]